MVKYLLVLIVGFTLHPVLEEISDYFWIKQWNICSERLGKSKVSERVKCIKDESLIVRVSELLLYRPRIAMKADGLAD